MIQFEKTAKVSSKGQITLPKAVRDFLHADILRVVIEDGEVRIRPVRNVAGSLKRYARKEIPMEQAREEAWDQVAHEKYPRR
ncbi:MAG: AbrB/MazE/SpoVT family DNA-binding domain-containing protein [Mariprofundaceae bacterium]|nr:AbrB/MazE/SpoVT family DNA-binding domain-containing protein [Mariprofundaceae bacterium]